MICTCTCTCIYLNLWLTLYIAYCILSYSLGVRQCLEHERDTVCVAEHVVADLMKDEGHVSRKRLPVTPRFLKGRKERGGRERGGGESGEVVRVEK